MIFTQFLSSLNTSTHTTLFSSHTIFSNEYTTVGKSTLTRFKMSDKIGRFSTDSSFIGRLYDTATRYCVFDCSSVACAACATASMRLSSFLRNQSIEIATDRCSLTSSTRSATPSTAPNSPIPDNAETPGSTERCTCTEDADRGSRRCRRALCLCRTAGMLRTDTAGRFGLPVIGVCFEAE